MEVYICEKPGQGRDVAKALGISGGGKGFIEGNGKVVTWCVGHLIGLAEPAAYGEQFKTRALAPLPILPDDDRWIVKPSQHGRDQLKIVGQQIKRASKIIISTDADREGEMIGRELLDYFNYKGPVDRLWLNSLDQASINKALAAIRPGKETEAMYWAGMGRSRADWLVGMNFSRAFTGSVGVKSGHGNLTIGRVQTPTLAIIVARDLEIEKFVAKDFYTVSADFDNAAGKLTAEWVPSEEVLNEGYCLEKATAEKVVFSCDRQAGKVIGAQTSKKADKAPLPLELSTLQQMCNRKFGFTADQTLKLAQSLYETHKVTTYPRTDCRYLPTTQLAEVKQVMASIGKVNPAFAPLIKDADQSRISPAWNDKKITAHHAIIPNMAGNAGAWSRMTTQERKVYELIATHYIAQFYPDYEYTSTNIKIKCAGYDFKVSGKIPTAPGWKAVFNDKADKADELPAFKKGDEVICSNGLVHSKKTKPPARMNEASLLAAMKNVAKEVDDKDAKKILQESLGIGTEATRASIIKGLIDKGYVKVVKKKELHSTESARMLIKLLPDTLTSPIMTARWEQALSLVEKGDLDLAAFMAKQAEFIRKIVDNCKQGLYNKGLKPAHECPSCGNAMVKRPGRNGAFWSCANYPDCRATAPDDGGKPGTARKAAPAKMTDKDCPKCGQAKLREVTTASNKLFLSCARYPDCNHSEWPVDPKTVTDKTCPDCGKHKLLKLKSKKGNDYYTCPGEKCDHYSFPEDPAADTGKACPKCNEGKMMVRTIRKGKSKGKTFQGCNNYPACDHTEWDN